MKDRGLKYLVASIVISVFFSVFSLVKVSSSYSPPGEAWLTTATVDINSGSLQEAYTVPIGKSLIITKIIAHSPSVDASSWEGNVTLKTGGGATTIVTLDMPFFFTSTDLFFQVNLVTIPTPYDGLPKIIAAGGKVEFVTLNLFGSAATLKIDVFGYLF